MNAPRNIQKEYRLEVIDKVFEAWENHPEMRLMQMLINACPQDDLFYVTNEKLLDNLKTM